MDLDKAEKLIPEYLLPNEKVKLFDEIKKFKESNSNTNIYLNSNTYPADILQGDAWGTINYLDPISGKETSVKGLILSNSCDASDENKRDISLKISFSPLLDLQKYLNIVENHSNKGRAEEVGQKIRSHGLTHIMYFPPSDKLKIETIALLDNVVSLPREYIVSGKAEKIHCLSQFGFYLFVIKLSIHFTRAYEGISRFD